MFLRYFMNDAFPFWHRVHFRSVGIYPISDATTNIMAISMTVCSSDFSVYTPARNGNQFFGWSLIPMTRFRLWDRCRHFKLARKWNVSESDVDDDVRRGRMSISRLTQGLKNIRSLCGANQFCQMKVAMLIPVSRRMYIHICNTYVNFLIFFFFAASHLSVKFQSRLTDASQTRIQMKIYNIGNRAYIPWMMVSFFAVFELRLLNCPAV